MAQPLRHQRGGRAVPRPRRALGGARRRAGAVRPQARLPAAGDEPRGQHDRLEGRRPARVRADHRRQGGAREDAGAGPECRVRRSGRRGLLFIVSAPSGTGKTTLVERLVRCVPDLAHVAVVHVARGRAPASPTAWTIISSAASASSAMIAAGEFLEWADVFGNYYGTSRRPTTERDARRGRGRGAGDRRAGRAAGAAARRRHRRRSSCMPPSFAVLEQRLRGRSKDTRSSRCSAGSRSRAARSAPFAEYDYVVVNDELEADRRAAAGASSQAERSRTHADGARSPQRIIETFQRVTMALIALGVPAASAPTRRSRSRAACRSAATTSSPS